MFNIYCLTNKQLLQFQSIDYVVAIHEKYAPGTVATTELIGRDCWW